MRDHRIVSSAVTSSALFLSMGLAHNLGGVIPNPSPYSLAIWVLSFLLLQKANLREISNSALASLVLLFQVLGHSSLSSSTSASTVRMSISHLVCGVLTFTVIRYGLNALRGLEKGLALFLTKSFRSIVVSDQIKFEVLWLACPDFLTTFLHSANQMRAPPNLATTR